MLPGTICCCNARCGSSLSLTFCIRRRCALPQLQRIQLYSRGICLCCGAISFGSRAICSLFALEAALSSLTFAVDADVLAAVAEDSAFVAEESAFVAA